MILCKRCGGRLPDGARFCNKCGKEQIIKDRKYELKEFRNDIGMRFRLIPNGEFMMGSEGWGDTKPLHKVKIPKLFHMGIYPVTQKDWKKLMGDDPSRFKGDDRPVENVSWRDAQNFIIKLNKIEKRGGYRLPTEIEWEYACRAGDPSDYFYENRDEELGRYAWYDENSGGSTRPVGRKKPNKWGLYDMLGNVWEWCSDRWHDDYSGAPRENDVWESDGDIFRVDRGGSWDSSADKCTPNCRDWNSPMDKAPYLGFRLVLTL